MISFGFLGFQPFCFDRSTWKILHFKVCSSLQYLHTYIWASTSLNIFQNSTIYICNKLFPHYPDMLQKVERIMEEIGGNWILWVSSHLIYTPSQYTIPNPVLCFMQHIWFNLTHILNIVDFLSTCEWEHYDISEYQMHTPKIFLTSIKFHFIFLVIKFEYHIITFSFAII